MLPHSELVIRNQDSPLLENTQIYKTLVHVPLVKALFFYPFETIMRRQTRIEKYVINKIREKRLENGFSQADLSFKLGLNDSFVSHVETPKRRAKYNINHLNMLAKIFECSIKDFFPEKPL